MTGLYKVGGINFTGEWTSMVLKFRKIIVMIVHAGHVNMMNKFLYLFASVRYLYPYEDTNELWSFLFCFSLDLGCVSTLYVLWAVFILHHVR